MSCISELNRVRFFWRELNQIILMTNMDSLFDALVH